MCMKFAAAHAYLSEPHAIHPSIQTGSCITSQFSTHSTHAAAVAGTVAVYTHTHMQPHTSYTCARYGLAERDPLAYSWCRTDGFVYVCSREIRWRLQFSVHSEPLSQMLVSKPIVSFVRHRKTVYCCVFPYVRYVVADNSLIHRLKFFLWASDIILGLFYVNSRTDDIHRIIWMSSIWPMWKQQNDIHSSTTTILNSFWIADVNFCAYCWAVFFFFFFFHFGCCCGLFEVCRSICTALNSDKIREILKIIIFL